MKNSNLAKDYLSRSIIRLKALKVLLDEGGYADVVREAQEIVELVSKSLIRTLGAEPARVHDVSAQLTELTSRLKEKDRKGMERLIEISRELRRDRELSFYGTEDLTPGEFYSQKDAKEAFGYADEAIRFVSKMVL